MTLKNCLYVKTMVCILNETVSLFFSFLVFFLDFINMRQRRQNVGKMFAKNFRIIKNARLIDNTCFILRGDGVKNRRHFWS